MIDLEEKLARLSPEKRRLLEQRLKQKKAALGNAFPLSYAQRRLWFLQQLEPNSTAYNIPAAIRLRGKLNETALVRALSEIVRRHEVLRTVFSTVGGEPVQIVKTAMPLPFRGIDLSAIPGQDREAELTLQLAALGQTVFDLAKGPLFQANLFKLADEEHVLHILMHHIVSDGWSVGVFVNEFSALYEAFSQGRANPLPPLPIQYADFAVWQRKRLEGEVRERELAFWRRKLSGDLPVLELPTDRPRPPVKSYRGDHRRLTLDSALLEKLRQLSRAENTTMFMSLLAGFYALLYRYTHQHDICVGTPIANRTRAETEGLIGFFVNTLVLRLQLDGQWSFADLLKNVREVALEAFAHQELPFEMLVEELQPERSMSHTPLFQVMFVYQNATEGGLRLPGLEAEAVPLSNKQAKFDITLTVTELADALGLDIEYDTDLFDAATVDRMLEHYGALLRAAVEDPAVPIERLDFLPARERQLVLSWGRGEKEIATREPVHKLFEEQVERTPDRVALTFDGQSLSYAELNARANRIAHFLIEKGVRPDETVAIYSERGLGLVPAILGVLKAGGAYLPIDPVYPEERVRYMLEDSGTRLVLTQPELWQTLQFDGPSPIWLEDENTFKSYPTDDPDVRVEPDNLVYVIYTSGSTGRPKGTLVTHRGLSNYLNWVQKTYPLRQGSGSVVHSSISFDATVTALFSPLISGGKVVLAPAGNDVEALADVLRHEGHFSLIKITPAHLEILGHQLTPEEAKRATRSFVIGGENLVAEQIRFWQENAPGTDLFNEYGPTETVVGCVVYRVPENWRGTGSVPIGSVIPNVYVYVVDPLLNLQPVGVPGELLIGGEGVARGYLNRADLTAERFVPDPFAEEEGARVYRTGDLVRYRADGQLEFLGRLDHQVKIRGYRIELGEIESVLREFEAIKDALVVAKDFGKGDRRLVAYVVSGQKEISVPQLREFLRHRLPEYMVPSAFVALDSFPLTPNGKIDRRALPAPKIETRETTEDSSPRSPAEELVCEIFAEVLGLGQVRPVDDFFELGGHSLLATQLSSRVKRAFGVDLPLREIFENTTPRALASRVEQRLRDAGGSTLAPIEPVSRAKDLPLSFSQQRLWVLDQLDPGSPLYNIPSAVRLRGQLDVEALRRSVNAVIQRHEVLRTNFVLKDKEPVQVIHERLELEIPLIDLSRLPEASQRQTVEELARQEATMGFDLARDPLVRVKLLKLSDDEHVALITLHHTVADGWSTGLMVREVASFYNSFLNNEQPDLPDLPIQYADYAYWQRQWLSGENLQKELDYWRQKLMGAPEVLELPTDKPRPPVQTFAGAHLRDRLDSGLTATLKKLARQENATLFMLLLAAFDVLLHRYTGQKDLVVGTPIANRTRPETEPLIGFFVNTLAIRTKVDPEQTFLDLLREVRETTLEAYLHQELPFEKLVEELNPVRSTSYSPIFQVMFVMQTGAVRKPVRVPGLELAPIEVENGLSPFDLTLVAEETPDGLTLVAEYNTDLFTEGTLHRLLEHYKNILSALAGRPGLKIAEIPVASEEERRLVLETWNNTHRPLRAPFSVHERVEQSAHRTPEALAVIDATDGSTLTYGELDRRANQLANVLREHGIGPETRVGLCLQRSPDVLVGMLGILKSGAAYVPLDPDYPAERLEYMIRDAAVPLVVTTAALRDRLPEGDYQTLHLDGDRAVIEAASTSPPSVTVDPHSLAYVIYTSGSTGRPKGVMVEHRSVVNHNLFTVEAFSLSESDRVLQFSTINFDTAVEEIFPALMAGASLVLRPRGVVLAVEELFELLEKHRVTVLDLPTAYWHEVADQVQNGAVRWPSSVRLVVVGGEKALVEPYLAWRRQVGNGVRWLNTYGPTETTVVATWFEPGENWRPLGDGVPIGRPITNVRAYVLDEHLRPVPLGVPGELCIGGEGVARGYLGRPEQTALAFVPDPFSKSEGSRLYRTGDRVRYLPDGNLQFLGRVDDQVKIRGYRVELGEVEAGLREHPDVREAAVLAEQTPGGGSARLIGYFVPADGRAPEPSVLREFLRTRLPDFMIPSVFVKLDALPRTPSGKIDRKALPRGSFVEEVTGNLEPEQPVLENELERRLADLWREVLGVRQVGATDNFFELGGDSILAIQLVAKARQAGLEITPLQIFQHQTLQELASVVGVAESVAAVAEPVVGPAPLTPIQRWFFEQNFANPNHWNQSVLFAVKQRLDPDLLRRAVAELEKHHDALRLRFRKENGEWIQVFGELNDEPSFVVVDLSTVSESSEKAAVAGIARTAQQSLNLQDGPIYRVLYLDFGPHRPGRVLFVVHHLAVDGVSWRILLEDLRSAYEQLKQGQDPLLPPRTASYRDWAEQLVRWANDPRLSSEIDFWTEQLEESVRPLPVDRHAGPNDERSATSVVVSLAAPETEKLLKEASARLKASMEEILLSALSGAFARWSGQLRVLLDLEGHGRESLFGEHVDVSRTVGWFTTVYPVLLDRRGVASAADGLRKIKETLRRIPNKGFGFGLLRYLSEDAAVRDRFAGFPGAEVSFNYLGQFDQVIQDDNVFAPASEAAGPDRDPGGKRNYVLDVTGSVAGGVLRVSFTYSENLHRRDSIETLAQAFLDELRALLKAAEKPEQAAPSAVDFPLANLDAKKLDKVLQKLGRS